MNSTCNPGRSAGFLYLLLVLTGPINLIYVPGKLIVPGDATATAERILASQSLFRFGIVSGVVSSMIFVLLSLALYRLLKSVNPQYASLMLGLVLAQVPMSLLNQANSLAVLTILRGTDLLAAFDRNQLNALAMLFLKLHDQGRILSEIFWGLWLFPLGLLVFKSRFIPRFLGVWLIINGSAYGIISFAGLAAPQYQPTVSMIAFPALLGEVALMLWLVIKGARPEVLTSSAAAAGQA